MTSEATSIDWNARARAQYLDPDAAVARVMREPTERHQLSRARDMLAFTRNPQYRFDLLASDIPGSVVSALEAIVARLAPAIDAAVVALAMRYRDLEGEGFASDEIWGRLDDEAAPLGYRYGDSSILCAIATRAGRPRRFGEGVEASDSSE
jgi:hypothetical protein